MIDLPSHLTDAELVEAVGGLAADERTTTAALVAHLVEFDRRQLATAAGLSLFEYCCEVLLLSEDATCNRTTAVRMVRRFPVVLGMLHDGRLNLSTLRVLAPYLTPANHAELLAEATRKSKRFVEELVARRFPKAVATSIRKLPAPRLAAAAGGATAASAAAATSAETPVSAAPQPGAPADGSDRGVEGQVLVAPAPAAARRAVTPMAEDVFLIKLAAKREMVDRLRYAQDLLGHAVPRGEVTEVFDRALVALIADLEKKKLGAPRPARPPTAGSAGGDRRRGRRRADADSRSRYVPVEVRRVVWARDGGRCAFIASDGRRCAATRFLEFHHLCPHEVGGEATVENIALRCRAHNQYEADVYFGPIRQAMSERAMSETNSIRPGADDLFSG